MKSAASLSPVTQNNSKHSMDSPFHYFTQHSKTGGMVWVGRPSESGSCRVVDVLLVWYVNEWHNLGAVGVREC